MSEFFDTLETRDPQEREEALLAQVRQQIVQAQRHAPAFADSLAGVDAATITSRSDLARLPVLRKHELLERQKARRAEDPLGGFSAIGWRRHAQRSDSATRVFASPGPIYEPEARGRDPWRTARSLHAAGFRAGDLVHNAFSYHFTPAGAMLESGAIALGCTVFPAGTGQTEQQVQAVAELQPDGYTGTPSFLKIIVERAAEQGIELHSLKKALVGGEAFPPSLRDWLAERGITAYQNYGTADLGSIAYETASREGLVVDEGVLLEIVRPGTGTPVDEGEVGEVVVTSLNPGYPLLRFGTGDLSAILPGRCPTGRTNARIRGWLGRADQTAKVRGMFVHPSQVADVARRFPELGRVRLVVAGEMAQDRMTLHAECAQPGEALAQRVAEAMREVTKLRGDVQWCAPGSLPNDGKVIDDVRSLR